MRPERRRICRTCWAAKFSGFWIRFKRDSDIVFLMRVGWLVTMNALVCIGLSLLDLGATAYLGISAPGYFRKMSGPALLETLSQQIFAAFCVCTGVGLILRKNWARTAMLVVAALRLMEGLIGLGYAIAFRDRVERTGFVWPAFLTMAAVLWLFFFTNRETKKWFAVER